MKRKNMLWAPLAVCLPVLGSSLHATEVANNAQPSPSPQLTKHAKPANPKMMYALDLKKDSAKWKVGNRVSHPKVIIMELVPEGQSSSEWREMLTNMVIFDVPVAYYVEKWQEELRSSAPTISLSEEPLPDGSVLVRYRSADESGFWRFTQGEDGIYAMAYQSKLQGQDSARLSLWEGLVKETKLTPKTNQ